MVSYVQITSEPRLILAICELPHGKTHSVSLRHHPRCHLRVQTVSNDTSLCGGVTNDGSVCMRTNIVVADPELPNHSEQPSPSDTISRTSTKPCNHTTQHAVPILHLQLALYSFSGNKNTITPIGKQVNIVLTQSEEQEENYFPLYFVTHFE